MDHKFKRDSIWLLWELFEILASKKNNPLIVSIVDSIKQLFCVKYSTGTAKKRKYLIYFAVSVITEKFNDKINIIENKDMVDNVTKKINLIYKEIKKNEQAPATDYLFNGIEKSSREKTFEKLEALKGINTIIRTER